MLEYSDEPVRTGAPEKLSRWQKLGVLVRGVNLPRPESDVLPDELGPQTQSLSIPSTDGVTLGAWHCPAEAGAPLVVLFHGYGAEKTDTLAEAKGFLRIGSSVMLVDFRGSGDSSESYTTLGYAEADDVAAAVNYAATHLSPSKIVLYGKSMGAAAVLRAVYAHGVRPDAIIGEAVFDTMLHTVKNRFAAMKVPSFPSAELLVFYGGWHHGFNGFRLNPVDYATAVDCPILFLHGSGDRRAYLADAKRVFDAVSATKEFKEFPNLGHAASIERYPSEWDEVVSRFLAQALADSPHR